MSDYAEEKARYILDVILAHPAVAFLTARVGVVERVAAVIDEAVERGIGLGSGVDI